MSKETNNKQSTHTPAKEVKNSPELTDSPEQKSKNSAKAITFGVTALLVVIALLYATMDQYAPSSSRGFVSAHVAQIAPRVSGQVT